MKCVIQGANIKIFAKAIHSLAKIGSDLFIEPDENALSLCSINSNKSAYASFTFNRSFFFEYSVEALGKDNDEENDDGKCRVSLKACLGIFKNMKEVKFCKIVMNVEELLVELHCNLNTKKNYIISIIDVETLQSGYNFDDNVSRVSAPHKIFSDISNNFQMAEEEITLVFDFNSIMVKNYVEGSTVDQKFMRSELTLKPDEFTTYSVKEKVSITFYLREFRSLLSFVESNNLDLIIKFTKAGKPALFTCNILDEVEANLLLSTLSPDEVSFSTNFNRKDITSNNQSQVEISSFSNVNKDATNAKNSLPSQNSLKVCEPLEDTYENTNNIIKIKPYSTQPEKSKKRARTVFSRCFSTNNVNINKACHSTILAENSDTE